MEGQEAAHGGESLGRGRGEAAQEPGVACG